VNFSVDILYYTALFQNDEDTFLVKRILEHGSKKLGLGLDFLSF